MLAFDFSWFERSEVGEFTSWCIVTRSFVMDAEEALGGYLALCDSDISSF